MTWNLFGQYLDVILSSAFIISLLRLKLQGKYLAISTFIFFDTLESLLFIGARTLHKMGYLSLDYRVFWCSIEWITWLTTLWMVYSLLTAVLKHLPGILRFSIRFLGVVFALALAIAFLTVRTEYAASGASTASALLTRLTALTGVVDRALSMAELLAILSILAFVLRFPIRVPRNLAVFSAGLSVYLLLRVGFFLLRTYMPATQLSDSDFNSLPGYLIAGCLIYWIVSIDSAGEETQATLGRFWQSVPREHLVRQLEAINAALLRSREQS